MVGQRFDDTAAQHVFLHDLPDAVFINTAVELPIGEDLQHGRQAARAQATGGAQAVMPRPRVRRSSRASCWRSSSHTAAAPLLLQAGPWQTSKRQFCAGTSEASAAKSAFSPSAGASWAWLSIWRITSLMPGVSAGEGASRTTGQRKAGAAARQRCTDRAIHTLKLGSSGIWSGNSQTSSMSLSARARRAACRLGEPSALKASATRSTRPVCCRLRHSASRSTAAERCAPVRASTREATRKRASVRRGAPAVGSGRQVAARRGACIGVGREGAGLFRYQ